MSDELDTEKALQILYDIQGNDDSVREDYSGRGMMGQTCIGITTPYPTRTIEKAAEKGLVGSRVDNMGMDMIIYWPRFKTNEEEIRHGT